MEPDLSRSECHQRPLGSRFGASLAPRAARWRRSPYRGGLKVKLLMAIVPTAVIAGMLAGLAGNLRSVSS